MMLQTEKRIIIFNSSFVFIESVFGSWCIFNRESRRKREEISLLGLQEDPKRRLSG